MPPEESRLDASIRSATSEPWKRYLALIDPLRPDLYRYCRKLTGNVWDAEDLIQDTLVQGFARLAYLNHDVESPRAYILRIASNIWITRVRREVLHTRAAEDLRAGATAQPVAAPSQGVEVREAASRVLSRLPPQEQASLVLKEVFELSLEETAAVIGTTIGAVKSALHRGRGRLRQADPMGGPAKRVDRAIIDRFVERFNARDREGLLALMLDSAVIDMPGVDHEIGREVFSREPGWFFYNLAGKTAKWETATFDNEAIVLVLPDAAPAVGSVMRFELAGDQIARIRVYAFCPDAVREVAAALGRHAAPMGIYRFRQALHD